LIERFEGETSDCAPARPFLNADTQLEGDLSKRGLDAYQAAYTRYTFCVYANWKMAGSRF